MARGVRKTYEEKLADIDRKIEKLETDKRNIIEGKEKERKDELLRILDRSGMSVDELRDLIDNNKK